MNFLLSLSFAHLWSPFGLRPYCWGVPYVVCTLVAVWAASLLLGGSSCCVYFGRRLGCVPIAGGFLMLCVLWSPFGLRPYCWGVPYVVCTLVAVWAASLLLGVPYVVCTLVAVWAASLLLGGSLCCVYFGRHLGCVPIAGGFLMLCVLWSSFGLRPYCWGFLMLCVLWSPFGLRPYCWGVPYVVCTLVAVWAASLLLGGSLCCVYFGRRLGCVPIAGGFLMLCVLWSQFGLRPYCWGVPYVVCTLAPMVRCHVCTCFVYSSLFSCK